MFTKNLFSLGFRHHLPDRPDTMFLNQSTFNPILYYHPILWFGYQNTTKYFKKNVDTNLTIGYLKTKKRLITLNIHTKDLYIIYTL